MEAAFINYTAQNIMTILNSAGPIRWSWGAKSYRAIVFKEMAALQFSVSGFVHKGKVVVALNEGDDLYEVYCLDKKNEVVNSQVEVYFDELISVIDRLVEKNCSEEEYATKSREFLKKTLSQ